MIAEQKRTTPREQEHHVADSWFTFVKRAVDAQVVVFRAGFQVWRALITLPIKSFEGAVDDRARARGETAVAAIEAAVAHDESLARTAGEAREQVEDAQAPQTALASLTAEQLDRLAATNNVADYPKSGTKSDKLAALDAADLTLEALTVEHLDRLASTSDVGEYPWTAPKREKIAALEAAAVTVRSRN